ncbi:MAG: rhomboid family intramembrane serine protease [Planctomycetota bacterium]|nr:rhomboid family intramembrane serine protease [Planctomycetota bacterium]
MYDYNNGEEWRASEDTGVTPVVRWLLITNVLIYLGMLLLNAIFHSRVTSLSYENIQAFLGFVPTDALENWHLWQFGSYGFLHAKVPFHLLFNMYILWWAGTEVERKIGSKQFFFIYLAAIVVSIMFHIPYAYLVGEPGTAVIGASGAVVAVMVLFAGFFPDRKLNVFFIFGPFSARTLVLVFLAIDVVILLSGKSQIAVAVHIGGAIFGYAFLKSRAKIVVFLEDMTRRIEEEERIAQRNLRLDLDNVLRKIHTDGMESLTTDEQSILKKASKHFRSNDTPG